MLRFEERIVNRVIESLGRKAPEISNQEFLHVVRARRERNSIPDL